MTGNLNSVCVPKDFPDNTVKQVKNYIYLLCNVTVYFFFFFFFGQFINSVLYSPFLMFSSIAVSFIDLFEPRYGFMVAIPVVVKSTQPQ